MLEGSVNRFLEGEIALEILRSDGNSVFIDVIVDTGFTGFLTLPADTTKSLGLRWRGRAPVTLADGSDVILDLYECNVIWRGVT